MREGKNMGIMTTSKKPTLERGGAKGNSQGGHGWETGRRWWWARVKGGFIFSILIRPQWQSLLSCKARHWRIRDKRRKESSRHPGLDCLARHGSRGKSVIFSSAPRWCTWNYRTSI